MKLGSMARALRFVASGLAGIMNVSTPSFRGGEYMSPARYHLRVTADMRRAFVKVTDDAKIQTRKTLG